MSVAAPGVARRLFAAFGLAFGALAALLILAPAAGSRLFGLPAEGDPALAYVRALGVRDLALALWLLVLPRLSLGAARALVGLGAVIPAGDLLLLLAERGLSAPGPLLLHTASGLALLALALWTPGP